jgi:hypothetical protein
MKYITSERLTSDLQIAMYSSVNTALVQLFAIPSCPRDARGRLASCNTRKSAISVDLNVCICYGEAALYTHTGTSVH